MKMLSSFNLLHVVPNLFEKIVKNVGNQILTVATDFSTENVQRKSITSVDWYQHW